MRRKGMFALLVGLAVSGSALAEDWGRFYHYPYSYFPQNYRKGYRSQDMETPYGYPMHPMNMAFPPYYRKDLYYPYWQLRKPGNHPNQYYQGNHYALDVF